MGKDYVIYEKDGEQTAHTESYEPKEGEKEVGRVEADSAEKALRKFKRSGGEEDADDEALARREPTEGDVKRDLEQARKEEEEKQDFEVLADSKGQPYIEGHDSDPSKGGGKKAAKAEPPPEPEESSLGTFHARDEEEALRMAKGEHKHPAEGPARGAQTP